VSASRVDLAFAALADPTRRGILEGLGAADASIGVLAERFGMTLTGAAKHVRVLEDAGLVATRKVGRVRIVTIGPRRLDDVARWIDAYRRAVDARLDRLETLLGRLQEEADRIDAPSGDGGEPGG
jgi:DNA-binding transcriptional ArsR family regulator